MDTYIVNIKQIDWIDREGLEADVLFEINGNQFWAFSHPCNFTEGKSEEVYFNFIEEEISDSAFWDENNEQKKDIIATSDKCRYYCYGQLKSIHPVVIDCGTITLSFGDWINDERAVDSYVYFVISRLDIGKA